MNSAATWIAAVGVAVGSLIAYIGWRQARAEVHRQALMREMGQQVLADARKEFSTNEDSSKFQGFASVALGLLGLLVGWLVWEKRGS